VSVLSQEFSINDRKTRITKWIIENRPQISYFRLKLYAINYLFKHKTREKKLFPCIFAFFLVSLHLEKAVASSIQPMPKASIFKSFGDRRKIFARPPQDIAPPAATICHGRGKLTTCRLAPCKP